MTLSTLNKFKNKIMNISLIIKWEIFSLELQLFSKIYNITSSAKEVMLFVVCICLFAK